MLTQASGAAIALLQGSVMRCRARAGATAPDLGAPLDTQSGLSGECVRRGTTLVCDDTENDPRVNLDVCRYLGIRSIAVLPISVDGEVVGIFEAFSSRPKAFSGNEVAALESMRDLVVSVVRPAPRPESPAVSALSARVAQQKPAPTPVPPVVSDPDDDLICEIEQRAPAKPQADPLQRALELIKTGDQEAAAPAAMAFANPDPGDDLICEIELRSYGPPGTGADSEQAHAFSSFAPAPAQPAERPVSRKLIVVGIIVALAGLVSLRWCNRAQNAARNTAPGPAAQAPPTTIAVPKPPTRAVALPAPDAFADSTTPPALSAQPLATTPYTGNLKPSAPHPGSSSERSIRPAPSAPRKGGHPAYAGARDGPDNPPLAAATPHSFPLPAPPHASSASSPTASAIPAPTLAGTQAQTPSVLAAVSAPPLPSPALPASVVPAPKDVTNRLSLSQAVVTASGSEDGKAFTAEALSLLLDSAKAGDGSAQLALAISYANGEGVRQSYPDALKWFRRAQAQGVLPQGERAQRAWAKVQQWAQVHPQKY